MVQISCALDICRVVLLWFFYRLGKLHSLYSLQYHLTESDRTLIQQLWNDAVYKVQVCVQ